MGEASAAGALNEVIQRAIHGARPWAVGIVTAVTENPPSSGKWWTDVKLDSDLTARPKIPVAIGYTPAVGDYVLLARLHEQAYVVLARLPG